jgi:methyl-accepting chemotaxis protein
MSASSSRLGRRVSESAKRRFWRDGNSKCAAAIRGRDKDLRRAPRLAGGSPAEFAVNGRDESWADLSGIAGEAAIAGIHLRGTPTMAFTISRRLALLVAVAVVTSLTATCIQLASLRSALFSERQAAIAGQVQTAASIVKSLAAQVEKGSLSETDAQERAKAELRAIRYGHSDYIFVYRPDGQNLVLGPRPELEGKNLMEAKDVNGFLWARALIEAGMGGGGYVSYMFPRAGSDTQIPKLVYALKVEPWNWIIGTGVYIDDLDSIFYSRVGMAAIWTAALIGALSAFAIPLARGLVRPLRAMTAAMGRLAAGDVTADIPAQNRRDEVGLMSKAVQQFKETAIEKARLNTESDEQTRLADAERRQSEDERRTTAERQKEAISLIGEALDSLSEGRLTKRITAEISGEYQKLKDDFNVTAEKLQKAMWAVKMAADNINAGAGEISEASADLSRRNEHQAASLEETATTLNEIMTTVGKTAEGAKHAHSVVLATKNDAERIGEVVQRAVAAMGKIENSSRQISQIISVIDEIAFQTNLLALNAGVEAARAGEFGRGFAVVASEVRALAQRSAGAAKEIKGLISASATEVGEGVKLVAETGESLVGIVGKISEINAVVSTIASGATEQSVGLQDVNAKVGEIDHVTQQNAAMAEQATASSRSLAEQSGQLASLIGQFEFGGAASHAARQRGVEADPNATISKAKRKLVA